MGRGKARKFFSSNLVSLGIIIIAMVVVMRIVKPNYFSITNIQTLCRTLAIYTLVGFSQMISISSGGMNLAVGSMGAVAGMMAGLFMEWVGAPAGVALVMGLAAAAVCGAINGLLIYRNGGVGAASFLATLATSSIFYGIVLTVTKSKPFYGITNTFAAIGNSTIAGLPTMFFIMLAVALILYFLYKKTRLGKQILAFGANSKAAEMYGVSKLKTVLVVNVLSALMAGLAGLMVVCRSQSAQPDIGSDWMLLSFSAALIGGAFMNGGKVNVWGTILGALIVGIVENALIQLNVNIYWNELFNGAIILIVVALDRIRALRQSKNADEQA